MATTQLLVELGYEVTLDGIEQAFLDGIVTKDESVELADSLLVTNVKVVTSPPRLFKKNKFERALSRFRIGSLDETENAAYRRYYADTGGLHPAVVLVGPDGKYYAFGNRGRKVA